MLETCTPSIKHPSQTHELGTSTYNGTHLAATIVGHSTNYPYYNTNYQIIGITLNRTKQAFYIHKSQMQASRI